MRISRVRIVYRDVSAHDYTLDNGYHYIDAETATNTIGEEVS